MRDYFKVSSAFTLAEILIALTVIGVVAALTIPNVMINTNAVHARTALKKGVASLNQAILTNVTDNGYDCSEAIGMDDRSVYRIVEKYLDAKLIKADATKDNRWRIYANFISNPSDVSDRQVDNGPSLADTENILPYSGSTADYSVRYYMLADGSALILPPNISSCGFPRMLQSDGVPTRFYNNHNKACIGFLDINGAKGPNQVIGCETKPDDVTTASSSGEYIIQNPGDPLTCEVKEKSITDVYPIVFYNDKVYPATYAAMTVFLEAQEDN